MKQTPDNREPFCLERFIKECEEGQQKIKISDYEKLIFRILLHTKQLEESNIDIELLNTIYG